VLDGRAKMADGGYDRWLIFQTDTRVPAKKKQENNRENFSARRQER
jgi:hypothetical protein